MKLGETSCRKSAQAMAQESETLLCDVCVWVILIRVL